MHKKYWVIAALTVVVLAIAVYIGTVVYAKANNDAAPEQLALSTATPTTATAPPPPAAPSGSPAAASPSASLEGDWKLATSSVAGYRVKEVLNGQDVTVVGRTGKVSGSASVAGTSLTKAIVTVDMTTLATDNGSRDSQFQGILKTSQFPTSTFTLTKPVDLTAINSGIATVQAEGQLSIAGVTKSVTLQLKAQKNSDGVQVNGTLPITFADYDVTAPNLGFVKVEDAGSIEMLLQLSK